MIEYGYCHCGCGERTKISTRTHSKYGWVKGEPLKYLFNHDKRFVGPEYIINEETGCWDWQQHTNDKGYGQKRVGKRIVSAHRHYFETYNGPIPDGLEIDHTCHNRACVNPDHLRLASRGNNCQNRQAQDGYSSKYKGVHWSKQSNKWCASIKTNSKRTNLGLFIDEKLAARAYDEAALSLFGEFAFLNFGGEI